jgi:carbamoyl-phosphate synthase large subunit
VLKNNLIELATQVMLELPYKKPNKSIFDLEHIGIKAPQFSFSRLQKADPVLGVDMSSTGEVGCIGENVSDAILKAMLSVGYRYPEKAILISSGPLKSKVDLIAACTALQEKGYIIYATPGTRKFLKENQIQSKVCYWPDQENKTPNALTLIEDKIVDLVVNIPKDLTPGELYNDYTIRRKAIDFNVPLITNARLASAFLQAVCSIEKDQITIKSWNAY